jgi:predicted outer membrane repeat protein
VVVVRAEALHSIIYVDDDAGPLGDGRSWKTAYRYLQDALDQAEADPERVYEIWVAAGVYFPDEDQYGDRVNNEPAEAFRISHDNVRLYGGFVGNETKRTERDWEANTSILSGDIDLNDVNADGDRIAESWTDIQGRNAFHVVYIDGASYGAATAHTVLDGFTLTAGDSSGTGSDYAGGGLYCDGSGSDHECSPTLQNLVFSGNYGASGGGMAALGGDGGASHPSLRNVRFSGNGALYGGGMYNDGTSGASRPELRSVVFDDNSADRQGGGMFSSGGAASQDAPMGASLPTLIEVTFNGNRAQEGGGMGNDGMFGTCNPTLINVVFSGNVADRYGGAMFNDGRWGSSSPSLVNVAFSRNEAWMGGGIYSDGTGKDGESSPSLVNVTFGGNQAVQVGGGMYGKGGLGGESTAVLKNVILWGNTAHAGGPQIYTAEATAYLSHCLVEGGCPSGASCWDAPVTRDPLFVDPGVDDLRLGAASPAIDEGHTPWLPSDAQDLDDDGDAAERLPYDLAQTKRVLGDHVDIGAYEFAPIFVDAHATGADDGTSWEDAYEHLQDALDQTNAGPSGAFEIWVADGLYYPDEDSDGDHVVDSRDEAFKVSRDVWLYGGFRGAGPGFAGESSRGQRNWALNAAVLSGDIDHETSEDSTDAWGVVGSAASIQGANARHVIHLDGTDGFSITESTIIDGFTITAGQSDGMGGGLYCDGRSQGHACSPTLGHIRFCGNTADRGGGMASIGYNGGASHPLLFNVAFTGNSATVDGGAMFNEATNGSCSPTLTNVTFAGNSASGHGGAIYSRGEMGNCSPHLTNVVLWGNTAGGTEGQLKSLHASPHLDFCLVQGGCPALATCDANLVTEDPLFVDLSSARLRLRPGSPAVDAGDNEALPPDATDADDDGDFAEPAPWDLRHGVRVIDGDGDGQAIVDLGAYEACTCAVFLPQVMRTCP